MDKKKQITAVFLFIILLYFSPVNAKDFEKSTPASQNNWLYVGGSGPGNYSTIQEAIDNATDGYTVFVYNGSYFGHININKSIHLLGEDHNTTFITGYIAYTISIVSDWATMSGFTIQNNGRLGEGVRIDSSHNNFYNNIINTPTDEIRISGDNNTISQNIVVCDRIFLSGHNTTFFANTITNNYYGIYFLNSWGNIISQNSFYHSGLFISDETVWGNHVTNNTVNDKPLFYIENESNINVDVSAGQILLINCTNITVQNQEIINTTVGIQSIGAQSCVITDNRIIGNHYGLHLHGWNNTIQNNSFTENHFGILLSGDNNTISTNILSYNEVAINLEDFTNDNTILSNIITHNYYGVLLDYGSVSNTIINNNITHNYDALRLAGNSHVVSGNLITDNNDTGINIGDSDFNSIIQNTITNNTKGIVLSTSAGNRISENMVTKNQDGIFLSVGNSGDNTVSDNIIAHNEYGIRMSSCSTTIILHNTVSNNDDGIFIKNSNNLSIRDNLVSSNGKGITLNSSSGNTISGNSLSNNEQGLFFFASRENTVYTNNFLKNKRHVLFENCTNTWTQNYWGRPRVLPKLIFGIRPIQNKWVLPAFDIDWHPAKTPYDNDPE